MKEEAMAEGPTLAEQFDALPPWAKQQARAILRKKFAEWEAKPEGPAVSGQVVKRRRLTVMHTPTKETK
jgi:hypothetical protein